MYSYSPDVPMCVQPMKSIAAVALTDVAAGTSGSNATGLSAESVTTAGKSALVLFYLMNSCVLYEVLVI